MLSNAVEHAIYALHIYIRTKDERKDERTEKRHLNLSKLPNFFMILFGICVNNQLKFMHFLQRLFDANNKLNSKREKKI